MIELLLPGQNDCQPAPTSIVPTIAIAMVPGAGVRRGWMHLGIWIFAFSCFFPYPGLPIGRTNGLQVSHFLALASLPFLALGRPRRQAAALAIILVPVYISMAIYATLGIAISTSILMKEAMMVGVAVSVLGASQWVTGGDVFPDVLAAACAAVIIHAAVGLYQVVSFAHDEFPLLFLYVNPSFQSMEEWGMSIARYSKRPFGVFPEPSAMAASLGPWLVLLAGLLLEPRLGRALGFERPWLARAAVVGGSLLIFESRSGFMGIYFISILLLLLDNLRKSAIRYEVPKMLALIGLFSAVFVGGVYATYQFTADLDDKVDSSWGYRFASIQMALTSNTNALNLLIGFGPGQSAPILERTWTGPSFDEGYGNIAVYSLAARHFMEMGMLGTLALAIVLGMVLRSILRSAAVPLGLSALLSWLVAVALTTSFMPLSAIWLFLGALLSWDTLFPVANPFARPSAAVATVTGTASATYRPARD